MSDPRRRGSKIFREALLARQVAIVSGGGSGLGRATTLELAALGALVVLCGRRAEPPDETVELAPSGSVEAVVCDIREEDQVRALVDGVIERHGVIDLFVNNAGGQFVTPAEDISPKGFRTVIKYPARFVAGMAGAIPLGRLGTPEEIAWLIAYLASPAGDFTSGSVITVDGARDNWMGSWPPPEVADERGKPLAEERRR